jgi:circadian clock protein KaiC
MTERISTGEPALDSILEGGFPANSINLLMGLPGTGKTVLAESLIFANADRDHKAVYFSTVSEPLDKIVRYLQSFRFFRPEAVQDHILFEDLSQLLRAQSLEAAIARIKSALREQDARFMVIDSFKALRAFCSGAEFRRSLQELAAFSTAVPLTSFWVGEYGADDMHLLPEFAVADGVVELVLEQSGARDLRYLRVLKLRGSNFRGGEHRYRISEEGLRVFPRLSTPALPVAYTPSKERAQTGVQALDAMIRDGFWKGSSAAVFGPAGSGKTLLGLHFLFKGMEAGERGLILSLQENPSQLARIVDGFGWDLQAAIDSGMLRLIYVSPVEAYIDEIVHELVREVREFGAERVMVDSLNDLESAAADPRRFRDFTYSLVQDMAVRGVSLFMTSEIRTFFGSSYQSEYGVSHMADNVILLHYLREDSQVKRAIIALKTRGSDHDAAIRQFTIDKTGFLIGEEFGPGTSFLAV